MPQLEDSQAERKEPFLSSLRISVPILSASAEAHFREGDSSHPDTAAQPRPGRWVTTRGPVRLTHEIDHHKGEIWPKGAWET